MRAYRLDDFKSPDDLRLRNEDDPRPLRGEVLVRVHAVSLNFRDNDRGLGIAPAVAEFRATDFAQERITLNGESGLRHGLVRSFLLHQRAASGQSAG